MKQLISYKTGEVVVFEDALYTVLEESVHSVRMFEVKAFRSGSTPVVHETIVSKHKLKKTCLTNDIINQY